jgi:hypothetical protein
MTKQKVLDKTAFLSSSSNLKREKVELDIGIVYVRELSGKALLEYNEKIEELKKDNPEINNSNSLELVALLVSKSACDEKGELLFAPEDVKELMDGSFATLKLLAEKAMVVSGIKQNVISEVTSNLKNAQTGSSTTS